jgi:ribosome biogenesis GTPase
MLEGVVIHRSSNDLRVDTPEGVLRTSLRGKFRLGGGRSPVVVGDRVEVSRLSAAEAVLERVHPRSSEVSRGTAGGKPVVLAANMDRFLIVLAAAEPRPRWPLADRMFVSASWLGLDPGLCLNKEDQVEGDAEAREANTRMLEIYRGLGYPTFQVSALRRTALDPLREWLRGRMTVVAGHSGVGKSTLLNALDPTLGLETGDLNEYTGKGRHTTTAVTLYRLPFGGYVADTPGFREFLPFDVPRGELGKHFVDFQEALARCRFKDCLHREEPGCAVQAAVEAGTIAPERYASYLQILGNLEGEERM